MTWLHGLRTDLTRWQSGDGSLLQDTALNVAEEWQAKRPDDLNPAEREYIEAGVARREALAAEKEAQRQALLDAERKQRKEAEARQKAEQQRAGEAEARQKAERQRAEEAEARQQEQAKAAAAAEQAAADLRKRAMWLAVAGIVAIVLAGVAGWFGRQSSISADDARTQAAAAETAKANAVEAAAVAETTQAEAVAAANDLAKQNEKTQAELNFYQTTDPAARLTELHNLFSRTDDPDSQAKARHLFFALPEIDQLAVLRATEKPETLSAVVRELLPNFGDVNGIYYTSEKYLTPLLESVEEPGLQTELESWLAARESAQAEDYATAIEKYDDALAGDDQNPALYLERARMKAKLGRPDAALADLSTVMELAQNPKYARSGVLPLGLEFANFQQMSKAVGHQIMAYELIAEYEATKSDYPALAAVELPTVIPDDMGVPMVRIPAGTFKMGSNDGEPDEQPVHEVDLAEFHIDQYEVSNAQYKRFIADGGYQNEEYWTEAGWQEKEENGWEQPGYWENDRFNDPDQPVVAVSWYEAIAYCTWRGGSLPSEAEWEKAARGTDERTYPWGEGITDHLARYESGGTVEVHGYPEGVSPYGVYNMAGNVWEWTRSQYDQEKYPYPYQADDDREELEGTNVRVLRGGGWGGFVDFVRAATRSNYGAFFLDRNFGFRCIR